MTSDEALEVGLSLSRAERRRLLRRALFRSLSGVVVLVLVYCLVPLQDLQGVHLAVSLSAGLLILAGVIVLQVRAITRSRVPGLQAVEALAVTAPLFLLMYAAAYFVMAQDDAANFSAHPLTRTDTLYFTLTVFSTVGFGDITATSQTARVIVMVQMVLDLVILGLGVQAYRGAVSIGRKRAGAVHGNHPEREGQGEASHD